VGAGLKAVETGTKAAAKLKSKDWKRLFADLTERVEQMSEALQEVLEDQRERLPEVRERAAAAAKVAGEKMGDVAEIAREKAGGAAETIGEVAGAVAGAARETAEKAKDKAPSFERKGRKKRRRLMGLIFNKFTVGFGAGYVLGAKAGRERYEQIVQLWNRVAGNPTVRQAAERGKAVVGDAGSKLASRVQERRETGNVREMTTPLPPTVQGPRSTTP
jgi:DNA-directed RNA polymerase subunit H (RpoH/RPB5)